LSSGKGFGPPPSMLFDIFGFAVFATVFFVAEKS